METNKKYVTLFTEDGFTMLEMVYSFAIFCIIAAFIPAITQFVFKINPDGHLQQLKWEVFLQQAKKEIRTVEDCYVQNNMIVMEKGGSIITYGKYQDKIRRRVNYTGHEVLLQNINSVTFEQKYNGVKITVYDVENRKYEAIIRTYIDVPGGEINDIE